MACAFSIDYCGAIPIPIDIERETWQMDVTKIEEKINEKTKAIMVVHLFGQPVDMDPVLKISKKYNLKIIEDCAEAHGVEYKSKKVGSIGDIGAFSFFANKTITCGEGGMVVTNSKELAEKARSLKNLAYGKTNKFVHEDIGFNYRLPNISAALGLGQFLNINKIFSEKKRIYDRYKKNLQNVKGIKIPIIEEWVTKYIMWVFNIYLDNNFPMSRDEFVKKLQDKNIETRNAFVPINKQTALIKKYGLFKENDCPNANYIMENGLYLPSGNTITSEEIDFICDEIKTISKSS
jgi:perosamine synthetase